MHVRCAQSRPRVAMAKFPHSEETGGFNGSMQHLLKGFS